MATPLVVDNAVSKPLIVRSAISTVSTLFHPLPNHCNFVWIRWLLVPLREYELEVKNEWNYTSTPPYVSTSCAETMPPLLLQGVLISP